MAVIGARLTHFPTKPVDRTLADSFFRRFIKGTTRRYTQYTTAYGGKVYAHCGTDIDAGDYWIACFDGTVRRVSFGAAYGEHLVLVASDGRTGALYAHGMRGSLPGDGFKVKGGRRIGRVDTTGKTTGRHLHFGKLKDYRDHHSWVDCYDELVTRARWA